MNAFAEFKLPAVPNVKEATKLAAPIIDQARELKISDDDSYIASWALIERHDAAIAKVGEWFDPFVTGLYQLHKMAVGLRDQFLDPLLASKNRLLAERKRHRIAQEAAAQKKRDADAEILRKQQAADLLKEAKKIERTGDIETATVLREQAATLPAPIMPVAPVVPKQTGSVEKTRWIATVKDYDLVPIEYKTLDHTKKTERALIDSKIQGVVAKLGNQIKIVGVEILQDSSEHSRAVR